MLDPNGAIRHLLRRKILSEETAVSGVLRCRDISRRNTNLLVEVGDEPAYVLKHGTDAERRAAIHDEAIVYRFFNDLFPGRLLPRLIDYDPEQFILVIEYVKRSMTLLEYSSKRGYSKVQARSLGRSLAALHSVTVDDFPMSELQVKSRIPFVLHFDLPPFEIFEAATTTPANFEVIRTVQQFPSFARAFQHLRNTWEWSAIVHSDMRLDNCLVAPRLGGHRATRTTLIDWEFACVGDPSWDLATLISHYLAQWILSAPMSSNLSAERSVAMARVPLNDILPAIKAIWDSYWGDRNTSSGPSLASTVRIMQMMGAVLVQIAYEHQQQSIKITASSAALLQLSQNVLDQPETAAGQLLQLRIAGADQ